MKNAWGHLAKSFKAPSVEAPAGPHVDPFNSASNPGGKGPWSSMHPYRNQLDKMFDHTPHTQGMPAHPTYFQQKGKA